MLFFIVLFYIGPVEVVECSGSIVRVGSASHLKLPYNSLQTYTGRVEACHNGKYVDVCNDTEELEYFISRACGYYSADYSKFLIS